MSALRVSSASLVPGPANANAAEFRDPHIDREIERAQAAQTANPNAARRLWERAERETVDQAPWGAARQSEDHQRRFEAGR